MAKARGFRTYYHSQELAGPASLSVLLCISAPTWPGLPQVCLPLWAPHLLMNLLPGHSFQIFSFELPRAQPEYVFQILVACHQMSPDSVEQSSICLVLVLGSTEAPLSS